jgi:nicotinate phosphoribosyltransferase
MTGTAVFEFFVRRLPARRRFLVAAGLEQVLEFLEGFLVTAAELEELRGTGLFQPGFLEDLGRLRFAGTVEAMPEGTVFFADEPILRITAPLPQAQVVETRVIQLLQFQTLIAAKAARCVLAAPGRRLVDFGLRRAHGAEAGLLAARATFLAGFAATSNVLAGVRHGIPLSGTMAHSYVQAHGDEETAFLQFARANPRQVTFLLDTYDTEAGAARAVRAGHILQSEGILLQAVRLDSGDLAAHARRVRRILDEGGQPRVRIFASGNLDEEELARLVRDGAPIDGFGVGTRLDVSADVPYLDCAYKIQEYEGRPLRKRSEGKATWPGRKQVWRRLGPDGGMTEDVVGLETESFSGRPLLEMVMREGRRVGPRHALESIRRRAAEELAGLPEFCRGLDGGAPYPVRISEGIRALAARLDEVALPAGSPA